MYSGIYSIKPNIYTQKYNKKVVHKENEKEHNEQSSGKGLIDVEENYHSNIQRKPTNSNFNNNLYPSSYNTQYSNPVNNIKQNTIRQKNCVNIHQIITDFKNTQVAISTPEDISKQVDVYLQLVSQESQNAEPNPSIIQTNLKLASKILDQYITDTLQKESHVVESWINAIFLQNVDYKANTSDVNEVFKLKFPQKHQPKIDPIISENLDILYPNSTSNIQTSSNIINEIKSENIQSEIKPEIIVKKEVTFKGLTQKENIIPESSNIDKNSQFDINYIDSQHYLEKSNTNFTFTKEIPYIPVDKELKSIYLEAKQLSKTQNWQEALDKFEYSLNYSISIGDKEIVPYIYYEVGKIYYKNDRIEDALKYFNETINTSTNSNNLKALSHFYIGEIYKNNVIDDYSCDHYFAAASYGGESGNLKLQSSAFSHLGEIYTYKYDKKNANEFMELAKEVSFESNDIKTIGKVHHRSGISYSKFNDKKQALGDFKISTQYLSKLNCENKYIVENYIQASNLMLSLNNSKKAKTLLNKALIIAQNNYFNEHIETINQLFTSLKT